MGCSALQHYSASYGRKIATRLVVGELCITSLRNPKVFVPVLTVGQMKGDGRCDSQANELPPEEGMLIAAIR